MHYINFLCVKLKEEKRPSVWTCTASPYVTMFICEVHHSHMVKVMKTLFSPSHSCDPPAFLILCGRLSVDSPLKKIKKKYTTQNDLKQAKQITR